MPELPEVEYTRRMLRPALEGARFVRVITRRADLRYPFPRDFAARLRGQTVRALARRAKYLLAELSSGHTLVMHLGMSGSFRVEGETRRTAYYHERRDLGVHDHVIFEMSSGRTVIFNDPRRFGFMKIVPPAPTSADWNAGAMGPEPLQRRFTPDTLARSLRRRKTTLKAALLDQRVVAGLGNIYVCEALHRARLSPKRLASTIVTPGGAPTPKTAALVAAIKDTLRDAIAHHHRPAGPDRFRVYDRDGERCPRTGCPGTIRRIVQGGRSTFFCPACQR
jgi:formamidopyrimidine-DNA glycosylase